jgi:hypothetical protein
MKIAINMAARGLSFVLIALVFAWSAVSCTDDSRIDGGSPDGNPPAANSSSDSASWATVKRQIESEGFTVIDHKIIEDRYYVLQKDDEYASVSGGDYYVTCYTSSGSQTGAAGPYSKSGAKSIYDSSNPKMDWSIE